MKCASVIIPSRSQPEQVGFLMRAIQSIAEQTARATHAIEVIVGLDPGAEPPDIPVGDLSIRHVNATQRSQASALNAAAAISRGDFVAFLEDDDLWHPDHLAVSLQSLESAGFASTTQLEVDGAGHVLRINDFPTPSGWVMTRSTWECVGEFNVQHRYHLDNEWLGRLSAASIQRVHLVEATAPIDVSLASQVRPWLANVLTYGGKCVRLARHRSPVPNVMRLVHTHSGMHQIATNPEARAVAQAEFAQLQTRFGHFPW